MASKISEISEVSRNAGNKFYIERSFYDALVKYNESLCHAESGSESSGLAYANRSAVYFEMKMFENSLRNIELAKVNGYPEKNLETLEKRAEKCREQIQLGNSFKNTENPYEFVKLSRESNQQLPFVAKCLELKKSKKFGRYIITNCDLNVGEIVAIEKPHFRVIKSDARYESCEETNRFQRCAKCLNDNSLDLIPCTGCSSTMFCSDECMTQANDSFHNYECPISGFLLKSGIMQMGMRVLFQALNMFNGSIEDLENFLADKSTSSSSYYDFDFSTDSNSMNKNFLTILYCLTKSNRADGNESPEVLFKRYPILDEMWTNHETFITKFIHRVLQIGDSNFHGICGWSLKKYENQSPQMIGIGCYPFISLVNHSCAPNVNRIYVEDRMFLLVERPIKKGEQLFDCYKNTFSTIPKSERQPSLLYDYSFKCECIACSNNFPLFHQLKSYDKKILKIARRSRDEISKLDKFSANRKFNELCEMIQDQHEKAFPSQELVLLQECILHCVSVIIRPKLSF